MQTQTSSSRPDIDAILGFFDEIGIEYCLERDLKGSFTSNMEIREGVIYFDYDKALVGDLLHEGGHLALISQDYRKLFTGNLYKAFGQYMAIIEAAPLAEKQINILMSCEDTQVTAWAWAVGVKLGLPQEDVISDESYDGEGMFIRQALALSHSSPMPYIGVSALHHASYTSKYNRVIAQRHPETRFYPEMNYWTVDQALMANGFAKLTC